MPPSSFKERYPFGVILGATSALECLRAGFANILKDELTLMTLKKDLSLRFVAEDRISRAVGRNEVRTKPKWRQIWQIFERSMSRMSLTH